MKNGKYIIRVVGAFIAGALSGVVSGMIFAPAKDKKTEKKTRPEKTAV